MQQHELQDDENLFRTVVGSAPVAVVLVDEDGGVVFVNAEAEDLFGYTRDELIGRQFVRLLDEQSHDIYRRHRDDHATASRRSPTDLELIGRREDGSAFTIALRSSTIETEQGVLAVNVVTDRSARTEQETMRTRELERRHRVAEGLRDVLALLNSDRPLDEILDTIVVQAGRLLDTDAVALYRLRPDDGHLVVQAAHGLSSEFVDGVTVPYGEGAVGRAVEQCTPTAISDVLLFLQEAGDLARWDAQQRAHLSRLVARYHAVLAVPLTVKDDVYGGLSLYYRSPRDFRDDEIELATMVADQVSLAITNARLRVEAAEAATVAERDRLARDLHDAVTQMLFSANVIAEALPRVWAQDPEEGRRRLAELQQLISGTLAEMRTLLVELRPGSLADATLRELLRRLGEATAARARASVEVDVEGECGLPIEVRIAFYRIAQEALNNVARHADAGHIDIILRCRAQGAELTIADDGRGFDPAEVGADHHGISIMRERADAIDATLTVASEIDRGTRVTVTWTDEDAGG